MILVSKQPIVWVEAIDENKRLIIEDLDINTTAEWDESVTFKTDCSRLDSFVLFGLEAKELEYIVRDDNEEVIKQEKQDLLENNITSWYDYLRGNFVFKDKVFIKLPFLFSGELELILRKENSVVRLAMFVLGENKYLGKTILPLTVGFEDLETFERDDNGDITNFGKTDIKDILQVKTLLKQKEIDIVNKVLKSTTGEASIAIADELQESSFLFGVVRGFVAPKENNTIVEAEIKIERI